ncbi:AraC family transcriptional regulator [Gilvimarinus polysaccharolyticus]|uniref:AraC family transcriptional regulator n=1 Tax=Gilvimarinus polysaccharolyticus TaxID=863921 RepID=UPI000673B506|nr:AraC family transcriptional regulator [Gilvimarinus polysaccharolyticus]
MRNDERLELATLQTLVEQQWLSGGHECAIDGLRLTRASEPSGTIRAVYQSSFCLVLQGGKSSAIGQTALEYYAGQCLVASVNVPVNSRIVQASAKRPYVALSLSIDPVMLSELLLAHPEVPHNRVRQVALVKGAAPPEVLDPLIRLLELCQRPQDQAVLEPLIRREICWRLLCSPMGAALQQVGLQDSETARIGKVTAWMRANYSQAFKVADLADMTSMSPASFYRHFKAITQMTPVQFQKQVRLQEARRLLLSEYEVAGVGYKVGYESPSQFSRDYRKFFGAPPGKDAAIMRSSVAIESRA